MLYAFKEDKEEELKNKLIFSAAKNILCEIPNSIGKETKMKQETLTRQK